MLVREQVCPEFELEHGDKLELVARSICLLGPTWGLPVRRALFPTVQFTLVAPVSKMRCPVSSRAQTCDDGHTVKH
eukprot:5479677-Amphidinium_carterae.2